MSDLAAERRALKKDGVAVDGEFNRAATVNSARPKAIKRGQEWITKVRAAVGPEKVALFEDATPIREGERMSGFIPGNKGITYDPLAPRGSGLACRRGDRSRAGVDVPTQSRIESRVAFDS